MIIKYISKKKAIAMLCSRNGPLTVTQGSEWARDERLEENTPVEWMKIEAPDAFSITFYEDGRTRLEMCKHDWKQAGVDRGLVTVKCSKCGSMGKYDTLD